MAERAASWIFASRSISCNGRYLRKADGPGLIVIEALLAPYGGNRKAIAKTPAITAFFLGMRSHSRHIVPFDISATCRPNYPCRAVRTCSRRSPPCFRPRKPASLQNQ